MKLTTDAQRQARYDRMTEARAFHTTPALHHFLERPDVQTHQARSGYWHLWHAGVHYHEPTLGACVTKALEAERCRSGSC